jgi:hypothetical protein
VNLQGSFNRTGIAADGSSIPPSRGLDGAGNTYSAQLMGAPIAWNGLLFYPGALGASNMVAAAGQTIALPGGSFHALSFLGTGVNGDQASLQFTVTYSDGSTQTFTQSMSDWASQTPTNPGESRAIQMTYRDGANATVGVGPFSVYGYSFSLDNNKFVKSITLPKNGNATIVGMTLS